MYEIGWIKKLIFAEASGRLGAFALPLFGGLLFLAVIAKTCIGFSVNSLQATVPFKEHVFKIVKTSYDSIGATEKITLPGCLNDALSFSGYEVSADVSDPGRPGVSAHDVSAIARIGETSSPAPVKPIVRTAASSRSMLFHPIINRAAAQYQVDPALVRAIIFAESGYNPGAVSKRGAMGLMQLMPGTAKAMGVEDCFDPEHNIFGGVKYFKKLINQFGGDVKLALAAYNAGSRNVRQFNGVPPFRATEHYIQKVMKYYKIYKSQQTEQLGLT